MAQQVTPQANGHPRVGWSNSSYQTGKMDKENQPEQQQQQQRRADEEEVEEEWSGAFDPFADPEERRVLFASLDSFR